MAKLYFARQGERQTGPFTLEELPGAGVTPDTYVWCKGMEDWRKAEEIAEISRFFRVRILDMMHPPVPVEEAQPEEAAYSRIPEDAPDDNTAPRTFLTESVIVTLFCSLIGLVGIFYAARCRKAWTAGNKEASRNYSRLAKMWCGISFFFGFITLAFYMPRFL